MKLQIEATDQLTTIDGVPVRYWRGFTEDGREVKVFIHRIAVHNDLDAADFDRELQEQLPPGRMISLRDIL